MTDLILDVVAAADLLAVSPDTVREWARLGRVPAAKIGKAWRFSAEQLRAYIEAAAEENVKNACRSTAVPIRRTGGFASRSAAAELAALPAPRIGRRRRNSRPSFAIVSGGKDN